MRKAIEEGKTVKTKQIITLTKKEKAVVWNAVYQVYKKYKVIVQFIYRSGKALVKDTFVKIIK